MNLARASPNEETRRREEEILDRIIPTGIMDKAFEEEDEEETDNFSECQTHNLEDNFSPMNHGIYSLSFSEEERSDEFIDEHQEEEDAQPSKPLITSYQDHRRQDKETVYPLSSELDDQLTGAKYFTEQDACWGYDDEHIRDKDKWEMTKTNQGLFEPLVIFSSPHSLTTSQTNTDERFLNQKNEQLNTDNRDNDIQKREQGIENTQCVLRRSRDNNLFTEPEEYTSWVTGTEYEGLFYPENQLRTNLMKLNGIAEWPTPTTTTKEDKPFLGPRNLDKEFTQNGEDLTKSEDELNEKGQDDYDIIMMPERLFPDLLDQELDDERTFEYDDEQFDPIKTLSVHEPRTLHNHFSKVTAATSVNDVIAANNMNKDPQKRITLGRDMDITVENKINISLGKRPNMWKD